MFYIMHGIVVWNMALEFLYLSQEDVIAAGGLDMKRVIGAVETALRAHAEKKVILPQKTIIDLDERELGRFAALPAFVKSLGVASIKWSGSNPANPVKHGLPRAILIIILNDASEDGSRAPLAIMEGSILSAMRTGAVTGVAAKYLASKKSEVAAVIGTGVQAKTQIMALAEVLHIKEVRAYDVKKERAEAYVREMNEELGLNFKAVNTPREAVEGAAVIVTATVADKPIVKNEWIKTGSLFAHVGSYQEEEYEVLLNSDKIVVDELQMALGRGTQTLPRMLREGLLKKENIHAELGEIVVGKKSGRENEKERIYFSPIGLAIEDTAVANDIYKVAKEKGIGQKLKLWDKPKWF